MSDERKEMQEQFEFWGKKVDEEGISDYVTEAMVMREFYRAYIDYDKPYIKPIFHGPYETMEMRPDYENLRPTTSSVVVEAAYSYANENWHLYDSEDYKCGWSEAYEDYLEHGDKLLEE